MRKNAVFAIYSIFKDFEHLIPDGPELMQTFLAAVGFQYTTPHERDVLLIRIYSLRRRI